MKSLKTASLLLSLVILFSFVFAHDAESAQKTIKWKMNSYFPKSFDFYKPDEYFVKIVNDMSGGRLDIELHPIGELVKTKDILDAVSKGVPDCSSEWPGAWGKKNMGFDILGTTVMLFTSYDYQIWLYQSGGLEIAQEMYEEFNIKWFPLYSTTMESGHRTNKPIFSIADYKGLRIRQGGTIQAEVLKALGAVSVYMPGKEIKAAMKKGIVDGCEYSSPAIDWTMGLHKVAGYCVVPGWYQTSSILGISINMDKWNKLPDDLKSVVEHATRSTFVWHSSRCQYKSMEAVEKFEKAGVKVTRLSQNDLKAIQGLAKKSMEKIAASDENYAKVAKSMISYLRQIEKWRHMQEPFSWGSGRSKVYPDIP